MSARVLVVSDYGWPTGGTEEFVNALLISLGRSHGVELLTWASSRAPIPAGVAVTGVENGDVLAIWGSIARADVVVVVTSFNVRLLARASQEALAHVPTPLVTIVQTSAHSSPTSSPAGRQEAWLAEMISRSDVVIGASGAVLDGLGSLSSDGAVASNLALIENGARLLDPTIRDRGRRNVLFIGRPTDSKGYPVFLRLVEELADQDLSFFANTVSVAPARTAPGIVYSRCLDDDELLGLFAGTDLVVAPYQGADGLPLALLEALNCGVPVLGFDSPAVGPLLRRYAQRAVECDTGAMIDALRAWSVGELSIEPPLPGQVPGLTEQADRHADLIIKAAGSTPAVGRGERARSPGAP
jgi:glycosyltransferase involved in cell wall biosynthesis